MQQLKMSSSWHCVTTLSIEVPTQCGLKTNVLNLIPFLGLDFVDPVLIMSVIT